MAALRHISTAHDACMTAAMTNTPTRQCSMIVPLTAKAATLVPDQTRLYIPTRRDIACASAPLETRLSSGGQVSAIEKTLARRTATVHAGDGASAASSPSAASTL